MVGSQRGHRDSSAMDGEKCFLYFGVLSCGNSLSHIQEAQEFTMRSGYISVALRVRFFILKGHTPMCLFVRVRIKMK